MADQSFDRFAKGYDAGRAQIVFQRVVADLETPVGAYLKLSEGRHNTFLLESVQDGATKGRYSMIGFDPDVILKVESGKASINRNVHAGDAFTPVTEPPLDVLRALVAESQADRVRVLRKPGIAHEGSFRQRRYATRPGAPKTKAISRMTETAL